MEFKRRVSNVSAVKAHGGGVGGSRVSMYQVAPEADVALEDFEQYALDRLHVLISIEENRSRGKRVEEVEFAAIDLWKKHMRAAQSDGQQQQKDVISHFVLRLVHCRTEELRRWFLEMETALFRFRFRTEAPESQKAFIEEHKLPYKAIHSAEFEALKEKLAQVMRSCNQSVSSIGEMTFYKVPFEEVLDLVAIRKVYVHQGYAFVPRDQLVNIVANHFRSMLSQALVLTNRNWTAMFAAQEEDRLTPILEALSKRYLAPDFKSASGSNVTLEDLNGLAMKSFPLCMRHMYVKLQEDHHLRHGGRQQLGLFLKGIGLKLEDALAFWRGAFAPKMPAEKFDKEYAYNVRHNYGKEGKRTDYTPYSCMYIIMSTPGVGDHHGCPYRHFSPENLHAALSGMRLSPNSIDEVMEKTRGRHYQLACAATFEGAHSCQCDGINHPNQYFQQSQAALKEKAAEKETDSFMTPSV